MRDERECTQIEAGSQAIATHLISRRELPKSSRSQSCKLDACSLQLHQQRLLVEARAGL